MNQNHNETPGGWKVDRVTSAEMAERMDCTPQAVNKAARKAGITQGHDGKYDAARLQQAMEQGRAMDKNRGAWNQEEKIPLLQWQTRHEEQKTRALERKNDIEEGRLVRVEDVKATMERIAGAVKNDLLSMPASIAPRLHGQTIPRIAAILGEAIADSLRHFAMHKATIPEPNEISREP